MAKTKKFGKTEYEYQGFRVVPVYKMGKPSGKYGIIAGKHIVSNLMSLKEAIELLKTPNFKSKSKDKKFNF
jgi:hypothetical protein